MITNHTIYFPLTTLLGNDVVVQNILPVGGGSINEAAKVETTAGTYFAKWNSAKAHPGMFAAEAKGLNILRQATTLRVPVVIGIAEHEDVGLILMEWIDGANRQPSFFSKLGEGLAQMHRGTQSQFGLDHDNYIGSLKQSNTQADSWTSFFIRQRIDPQVRLAADVGLLHQKDIQSFEALYTELPNIFPVEKPALVHGDLWSGNFLCDDKGLPALIDPAIYFGHREADIAMTMLFGGFDEQFYQSYHAAFPMANGWRERMDIYNLYPLLVHVNLFGGGYLAQLRAVLSRFY